MSNADARDQRGAKILTPQALEAARVAADTVAEGIERWEQMTWQQLATSANDLWSLHDLLVERFLFVSPLTPQQIDLMKEWHALVDEIPNRGFARFLKLLTSLEKYSIAREFVSQSNSKSANGRWGRLEPVKAWAFDQRRADPSSSRASFIKGIVSEIRARAKAAGSPLTGDNDTVVATVTRWFREAGIK